jgi:hypothetical protein
MTGPIDLVQRLESWLAEDDGVRLPERVIDAVIAEAGQLPQAGRRGSILTPGRVRMALGVAAVAAALVLGVALYQFVAPPVGTESPSPSPSRSASQTPAPSVSTPSAAPTPALYTSPMGFAALQPIAQHGWGSYLYAPIDAGGTVFTFPDGEFIGGDVWASFIVVSVGTAESGAIVGVTFPETPSPAPSASPGNPDWANAEWVRVWAPSNEELAAAFVAAVGGQITGPTLLGDRPAVGITNSQDMARTVVCVDGGRAFIVSTTSFMRNAAAPGWDAFLAGFRFLD